ncbi:MAG: FUSC family protein [Komagataeibacter hansenii]|nr:FUSC family protein [Novacetimonas hansenii]
MTARPHDPDTFSALLPPFVRRLSWLYAPSLADFAFALRTAFAAILSLLIAMWMELDSPQWAPLTVWVVAQSSRGESLAKARWRVGGTLVGSVAAMALIAAFPQAPGLFFCALAAWIGLCCAGATLLDNYRAYGLVLTGFTSAIIATGAILEPDHVFDISVARTSYIVLGVVCEATLAIVFMPSVAPHARQALHTRLMVAFGNTTRTVADLLEGEVPSTAMGATLGELVAFNSQVEFSELELEPGSRTGDHARAALAAMLGLLARARGVSLLLAGGIHAPDAGHDAWEYRRELCAVLRAGGGGTRAGVARLQAIWRDRQATAAHPAMAALFMELLAQVGHVLSEIHASDHPVRHDRFRFRVVSRRHAVEALENGVRASCAILGAWLVWEVTAWRQGAAFISFLALVYGLLATRENPVIAGTPFFKGGLYCAGVGTVLAFWVIPAMTAPEMLVLALLVPMTIGGLAARNAATAGYAFSFNMFLPVLVGPMNQGRIDEAAFLNGTLAFLCSILFAILTYRIVVPFRIDSHMRRTAAWTARRLRGLGAGREHASAHQWLAACAGSLVRILRNSATVPPDMVEEYMRAQLRAMTLGLSVIALRDVARRNDLPPATRQALALFMRRWHQGRAGEHGTLRMIEGRVAQQVPATPQAMQQRQVVLSCLYLVRMLLTPVGKVTS